MVPIYSGENMRSLSLVAPVAFGLSLLSACHKPKEVPPAEDTAAASSAATSTAENGAASSAEAGTTEPSRAEGALHLGAPIEASTPSVALSDVARAPKDFVGKTFVTQGTVTAVCQHKGCWMELKDDAGEAHVKMAGHKFFVPKTASGHKARVLSKLVLDESASCGDDEPGMAAEGADHAAGGHRRGGGCREEAEAQLGRPLAKLSLVAEGVELL